MLVDQVKFLQNCPPPFPKPTLTPLTWGKMLACMNPAKCWLRGGLDECTWVSQKPKLTGLKSLDSEAKDITALSTVDTAGERKSSPTSTPFALAVNKFFLTRP